MADNSIQDRIENEIVLDKNGVWILANREKFNYSDGRSSELYLKRCFAEAKDLSSMSYELEGWIKDWPSEYHLSRKRAQLLSGFDFDRSKKVLEVGCGCGAITRFLGETFDDVVAIEGSVTRSQLARMRTKGMENITILNAPFQEIKFKKRFDIVFCIGVFEYSNIFVNAAHPYDFVLKYFYDILNYNGLLVIAIENQFGLKYFSNSREDHTNVMFDGLEGYPRYGDKAKTFGYNEIKYMIGKHFDNIDFYFPYPDYKIPSCVLSEEFTSKVRTGELIGNFPSRNYIGKQVKLFDEKLVLLELDKNNKLPFFSNSFLIFSGKRNIKSAKFNQMGIIFSSDRRAQFQTVTRFIENDDGDVIVYKFPMGYGDKVQDGSLLLQKSESRWVWGLSLNAQIMKRVKESDITYEELFAPCKIWLKALHALSFREGDTLFLDGKYIDCIWRNIYIHEDECVFVDREWEWSKPIQLNVIIIRAVYSFLKEIAAMIDLSPILNISSWQILICRIAKSLDIEVNKDDFAEFVYLQAEFSHNAFGVNLTKSRLSIKFVLLNERLFVLIRNAIIKIKRALQSLHRITCMIRDSFLGRY